MGENIKNIPISPIEEQLIGVLKDGGPLTRDQLVKKMEVPRTTIYDGLKKLIQRDEVKKYPYYQTERSRGRPQVLFSLLSQKK
jgi:predicted ArsR family transcriptional regulator